MRRLSGRWLVVGLAVLGALGLLSQVSLSPTDSGSVGASSGDSVSSSETASPVAVVAQPDETPGEETSEAAPVEPISVFEERSINGATASALHLLDLSEELVHMAPVEAGAIQASMATSDRAVATAAEVEAQVQSLSSSVGPTFSLAVAPIKWSVIEVEADVEYQISIWYLEVFDRGDGADVVVSYKTYSASLVWEAGWKLADSSVISGPTPAGLGEPTRGQDLASRLGGFHDGGDAGPCCPMPEAS